MPGGKPNWWREEKLARYKLKLKIKLGLIIFLAAIVLFCTGMAASCKREIEYRLYCVKPGDTLWSIAKECDYGGDDIRETIWLIKKKNGMDQSAIYVGDLLYIPTSD